MTTATTTETQVFGAVDGKTYRIRVEQEVWHNGGWRPCALPPEDQLTPLSKTLTYEEAVAAMRGGQATCLWRGRSDVAMAIRINDPEGDQLYRKGSNGLWYPITSEYRLRILRTTGIWTRE